MHGSGMVLGCFTFDPLALESRGLEAPPRARDGNKAPLPSLTWSAGAAGPAAAGITGEGLAAHDAAGGRLVGRVVTKYGMAFREEHCVACWQCSLLLSLCCGSLLAILSAVHDTFWSIFPLCYSLLFTHSSLISTDRMD